MISKIGPVLLQLLAGRQEPARALAADHARRIPQGRARLGDRARPRRPGQGGEGELGLARGQTLRARLQAVPCVSLSRGGADADRRPRVRPEDQGVRRRTASPCPRPRARSPGGTPTASSSAPTSGPGSLTESGYPRIVKEWKRGTPLAEAAVVFEGQPDDMSVGAHRDLTPGFERDFVIRRPTFLTSRDASSAATASSSRSRSPTTPRPRLHREWLLLAAPDRLDRRRQDLPRRRAARDRPRGVPQGDRGFDVLFEPTERKSLAGFSATRNYILLNELDNVRSRIYVLTHKDGQLAPRAAAGRARVRRRPAPRRSTPTSRTTTS